MPDISMCLGFGKPMSTSDSSAEEVECPRKEDCYRFKTTPSEYRQSYFLGIPYDKKTDTCRHFLTVYPKG